jgi:hypothetical protein
MKPFHIATRSKLRQRIDTFAPGILAVAFALGFIADKLRLTSPTFTYWLRWGLYLGLATAGIYVMLTLVQIVREPVNYRSLRVSGSGLEYEPVGPERLVIPWDKIESVVFCREEALFESYLETKWLVRTRDGNRTHEIMDEWGNRKTMYRALRKFVPGVNSGAALRGFRSWRKGKWVCLQR